MFYNTHQNATENIIKQVLPQPTTEILFCRNTISQKYYFTEILFCRNTILQKYFVGILFYRNTDSQKYYFTEIVHRNTISQKYYFEEILCRILFYRNFASTIDPTFCTFSASFQNVQCRDISNVQR